MASPPTIGARVILCGGIAAILSACTSDSTGVTNTGREKIVINVAATASLALSFNSIIDAFEMQFPEFSVSPTFAGSATLVTQIQNGASADVVALADTTNIDKLGASHHIDTESEQIFATNTMTIVVPRTNPKKITGLTDLDNASLNVVLCAPAQPCGAYAKQILEKANLRISPKSLETSVSGVVSKVSTGQADAGIAYYTDALAATDTIDTVRIPESQNIIARYPIARGAMLSAIAQQAANTFIAFVVGKNGADILTNYGFMLP
ncbi:MAG: molybdate ABC transporter substrate-binding protein [Ilumatobacteraceae bacterium]|nr:molybdate ABC transporter substrate-binding protein [Ilumatobacteraceae bacterium]